MCVLHNVAYCVIIFINMYIVNVYNDIDIGCKAISADNGYESSLGYYSFTQPHLARPYCKGYC